MHLGNREGLETAGRKAPPYGKSQPGAGRHRTWGSGRRFEEPPSPNHHSTATPANRPLSSPNDRADRAPSQVLQRFVPERLDAVEKEAAQPDDRGQLHKHDQGESRGAEQDSGVPLDEEDQETADQERRQAEHE